MVTWRYFGWKHLARLIYANRALRGGDFSNFLVSDADARMLLCVKSVGLKKLRNRGLTHRHT